MHDSDDPDIRASQAAVVVDLPHTASTGSSIPARGQRRWFCISVSGFCSGVGKTTVVESILGLLRAPAALKVTTVDSGAESCPIDRACGVCAALERPFDLITDERRINVGGKDTGRYWRAGARPVIWAQAHANCMETAVAAALSRFDAPTIVLEGNTPVPVVDPDLAIMVERAGERRESKASAALVLRRVQLAILNVPADSTSDDVDAARRRLARDLSGVPTLEIDARRGDSHRLERFLRPFIDDRRLRAVGDR